MQVVAEILPGHREARVELAAGGTGLDLLRALRLAPDAHILVRTDRPIPADEILREGDRIQIIGVVSGGSGS